MDNKTDEDLENEDKNETKSEAIESKNDENNINNNWKESVANQPIDTNKGNDSTNGSIVKSDSNQINIEDIEMSTTDSIWFLVCIILAQIFTFFILYGVCHWIYNYLNGLDWTFRQQSNIQFNFHIFFMSLALCLSGFGLLTHRIFRGLSLGALKCLHSFITLLTTVVIIIGLYFVIVATNSKNHKHFCTIHSWFGLITIILFTMTWISAFVIFVFPSFIKRLQRILIPIHGYMGRTVFAVMCGTAIIGISDKLFDADDRDVKSDFNLWQQTVSEYDSVHYLRMPDDALLCNIIGIVIVLYASLVLFISANHTYRRRTLPEESRS